jgi:hypothetical protein
VFTSIVLNQQWFGKNWGEPFTICLVAEWLGVVSFVSGLLCFLIGRPKRIESAVLGILDLVCIAAIIIWIIPII